MPDPGNPLDWDRYAYTRNNPEKYVDPNGHFPLIFALVTAAHWFGLIPDFQGILRAQIIMGRNGQDRIDIAAALAVQSQWLNPYDYINSGRDGHGMGLAQVSWSQMHEYGISGDP